MLLAAGIYLRFHGLDRLSLSGDELDTANCAKLSVDRIVAYRRALMLQYLIVHWLLPHAAATDWWLRFPTALYGALSLMVMYAFVRRVLDRSTAFVATALLAFNLAHLVQSQNARYYGFLGLMTLLSMLLLFELFRRFRWQLVPALVLTHALNVLNHPVALFVLAAEGLCALAVVLGRLHARRSAWTQRIVVPLAGLAVLSILGAVVFWNMIHQFIPLVPVEEWPEMARRNTRLLYASTAEFLGVGARWRPAAAALFGLSLIALYRKSRTLLLFTILLYGVAFVGLVGARWIWKELPSRYVFFWQPVLVAAVANCLVAPSRWLARRRDRAPWRAVAFAPVAALIGLWAVGNVGQFHARKPDEDWRGAIGHVQRSGAPGDFLVAAGQASMFAREYAQWYVPKPSFETFSLTSLTDARPPVEKIHSMLVAAHPHSVWLFSVYDRLFLAEPGVGDLVSSYFEPVGAFGQFPRLYRTASRDYFRVPDLMGWDIDVSAQLKPGGSGSATITRTFYPSRESTCVLVVRSTPNIFVERLRFDGADAAPAAAGREPRLARKRFGQGGRDIAVTFRYSGRGPRTPATLVIRAGEAHALRPDERLLRSRVTREGAPPMYLWSFAVAPQRVRRGQSLRERVGWKFQDPLYFQPRFQSVVYQSHGTQPRTSNRLLHSRVLLDEDGWYIFEQEYETQIPPNFPPAAYTVQFNFLPFETGIVGFLHHAASVE
jgi:hypothetical protein